MAENRDRSLFLKEKDILRDERQFQDRDQFPAREIVPKLPLRQPLREPYTPKQELMTDRVPR